MGPDYTHWHGTYEVGKHFYTKMIPKLETLIRQAKESADPKKATAAEALQIKLDEVLNSPSHRWYLDKMDPAESRRAAAAPRGVQHGGTEEGRGSVQTWQARRSQLADSEGAPCGLRF